MRVQLTRCYSPKMPPVGALRRKSLDVPAQTMQGTGPPTHSGCIHTRMGSVRIPFLILLFARD
jgi:hypothetical protein